MLLIERENGVATVTINRPEAMNAMSRELRRELDRTFKQLRDDDSIRAVVLTGAGTRAFTAGLDLKELGIEGIGAANATTPDDNPVLAIQQCGKPIIGAINGVAITGGFELALACDVLIASTNARFADTHARVGITPGWGLSQKLSRIIGVYRAKELSLTGNFVDAKTACDWGLVNRVVEPDELMPTALKLAHEMATVPLEMLKFYKFLIDDGYALPFGEGLALEHARSSAHNAHITPADVERTRLEVVARGRKQ
ncbi:MAG: enoyl-CoA hydratase [Alphaproteobacteria bacterium]